MADSKKLFRILCLDGGGSKGCFSLGVLKHLEMLFPEGLDDTFDMIYGTSTGAIIAAFIRSGKTADQILSIYKDKLPDIMKYPFASARTRAMERMLTEMFGEKEFTAFKKPVAFISTGIRSGRLRVFKSHAAMSHSIQTTFVPGGGFKIRDALMAATAAYPYFKPQQMLASFNKVGPESEIFLDGGYIVNNPSIPAWLDAMQLRPDDRENIRVLNIGTGVFPETPSFIDQLFIAGKAKRIILELLNAGRDFHDFAAKKLLGESKYMRVDDEKCISQTKGMLESRNDMLDRMAALGGECARQKEQAVLDFLGIKLQEKSSHEV